MDKDCQSCGMSLTTAEHYGTNADGSASAEYCVYCFKGGDFTADVSMEEMINFCGKPMLEHNAGMTAEQATSMMKQFFPTLKRWKR